jgi:hypothetical protein
MTNLTTLFVLGVIALMAIVGMLVYYLDSFNDVPEGQQVKVALAVATKYDLTNFRFSRAARPGGEALLLRYETKALKAGPQAKEEMLEVAGFTWNSMKPEERRNLVKVEVFRDCVRSVGCFKTRGKEMAEWTPPAEPAK